MKSKLCFAFLAALLLVTCHSVTNNYEQWEQERIDGSLPPPAGGSGAELDDSGAPRVPDVRRVPRERIGGGGGGGGGEVLDEEPASSDEPPLTPYEVISLKGVRVSSCFDFSVQNIGGGNSIPIVVYEQNLFSRRKLIIAERVGGVWRSHTLLDVEDVSSSLDCFFKPALLLDVADFTVIAAKGSGNSLKLLGSWRPVSEPLEPFDFFQDASPPYAPTLVVGSSNIDMISVATGALKTVYRTVENSPHIDCRSSGSSFCTRTVNTVIPDLEAHLVLLPWTWEWHWEGECPATWDPSSCENVDCEKVLRFAGTDENVRDVFILRFCRDRHQSPAIRLNLPEGIKNPFFAMGPGEDRFTIVYAQPPENLIRFCHFNSEGAVISGSCENVGVSGKHPSIAVQTDGGVAISYTVQNGLRLSKKGPAGRWNHAIIASQDRFDFGKSSMVQLAPVGGVLHTHIVYTAYDYAGKIMTLRYASIL